MQEKKRFSDFYYNPQLYLSFMKFYDVLWTLLIVGITAMLSKDYFDALSAFES